LVRIFFLRPHHSTGVLRLI